MPTLKDLARHLNLSVTQVSRALNDHADVSGATKRRVRAGAAEIGYRPNLAARKLRAGRSGIVAMVVPGRSETAEVEILMESVMGLSAEFSRRGLQFVLNVLTEGEDPLRAHERLVHGGATDGFVLTDPRLDDPRIAALAAEDIPFIVHGRDRPAPDYPFVDIDNVAVGAALAEALIARGARRIADLGGPGDRPYARLRAEGIAAALGRHGLPPASSLPGPMTESRGRAAAPRLLAEGVDGVIAGNMMLAAGLRDAAPDLPIAAHDDALTGYGPDRVAPPLWRSLAPLDAAWAPLCDGLSRAIAGEVPQVLLPVSLPRA